MRDAFSQIAEIHTVLHARFVKDSTTVSEKREIQRKRLLLNDLSLQRLLELAWITSESFYLNESGFGRENNSIGGQG